MRGSTEVVIRAHLFGDCCEDVVSLMAGWVSEGGSSDALGHSHNSNRTLLLVSQLPGLSLSTQYRERTGNVLQGEWVQVNDKRINHRKRTSCIRHAATASAKASINSADGAIGYD